MFFKLFVLCCLALYGTTGQETDNCQCNARIDEKLLPVISRIKALELSIQSIRQGNVKYRRLCQAEYNGKCFWVTITRDPSVVFTMVDKICGKAGGYGAKIYDRNHYEVIRSMIPKLPINPGEIIEVWTGVRFNQETGVAYDRDGNVAYGQWYPQHPYTGSQYSDWTAVRLRMESIKTEDEGMMTGRPMWKLRGALCEGSIEDYEH